MEVRCSSPVKNGITSSELPGDILLGRTLLYNSLEAFPCSLGLHRWSDTVLFQCSLLGICEPAASPWESRYLRQLPLYFLSHPKRFSFLRPDVCKLKFEGKTFYVIGTQKEVRYCFSNSVIV